MRITKLEYQKKDPNRVNVYVDDKFAVGLDVNEVIKLGIANNQKISQDELNKLIESSNFGKAFNAALNFLSFRPRSELEIRQYLKRKKAEDLDGVIAKLKQIGQINDEEFAKWLVEQRSTFRPKGKRLIEMELRQKGVKIKVSVPDEEELAMKAIQKKLSLPKEKIFRFLASRGFDYETIEKVVAKLDRSE
jgi:regulatory protein